MTKRIPRTNEQRLHMAIVAVAAALAVVMVAAAGWALTRPGPPGALLLDASAPAGHESQGATPTSSSAGVVATGSETPQPAKPAGTTERTPSNPATSTQSAGRRVAFHIGLTLYISSEDGKTKTPMHIVGTDYALSPDGRTVAAVEKGKLVVASVGQHLLASSPATPGLTAEAIPPVWMPDSSAVLFIRANASGLPRIWRLDRATGTATDLGSGAGIAISPNGHTIVALPTEDDAVPVVSLLTLGGARSTFRVPSGDPVAVAIGKSRVFVSTVSAAGISAVWSFGYDGSEQHKIVGFGAAGSASVTFGELMLSPDGTKLLFAADGDDGYSRLWTVPSTGGTSTAISGRRDGYALGWTRDGKGVLFIEGNAFQGQATSLWLSDLTGHRRKLLVAGATL